MADIEIRRVPRIDVKKAGTLIGTRPAINLIEGSNVTLTVADDSAGNEVDVTIAASGAPSDFQPAIVTGNYYYSKVMYSWDASSPQADKLIAYPIWFSHDITWTRIGLRTSIGSGSATEKMRLGIYTDASGLPDARLVDSGELSLQTDNTDSEATISQALTANTVYWLVQNTNDVSGITQILGDITSFNVGIGQSNWMFGGATSTFPSIGQALIYYRNLAYGALPASFGTPDGKLESGGLAAIWLRKV